MDGELSQFKGRIEWIKRKHELEQLAVIFREQIP